MRKRWVDEAIGGQAEGQDDEGRSPEARVIRTVSPWLAQIFVLVRLIPHLAFHDAIQAAAIR
jgi:hypothetical protein